MKSINFRVLAIMSLAALALTVFVKGIVLSEEISHEIVQSEQYEMPEPFSSGPLITYSSIEFSPGDS